MAPYRAVEGTTFCWLTSLLYSRCWMLGWILVSGLLLPAGGLLSKDTACGVSKGCYHQCTGGTCSFLISWRYRSEMNTVQISMMKTLEFQYNAQWFAMGLSKDTEMGDDSVIECVMDEHMDFADVYNSYNVDKYNVKIYNAKAGLRETVGGTEDGVLSCNFTRNLGISYEQRIFDLQSEYYILVADGLVKDGVKLRHSLNPLPAISQVKVDFRSTQDVDGNAKYIMVKVHGCLMVYAWILSASIAVIVARYYKQVWPYKRMCGQDMWLSVHRGFMISTVLVGCGAVAVVFVHAKGFSLLPGHSRLQRAHPIIGVIVTCLMVVNPILACLRPPLGSANHHSFKWSHTFIGIAAYVLGVFNVMIGVTLHKSSTPPYTLWVLVAFAVYQVLVELTLELHEWYLIRSGKQTDYEMKDVPQRSESQTSLDHEPPPGSVFKKIVLSVHILVVTGVGVTCIFIVALC